MKASRKRASRKAMISAEDLYKLRVPTSVSMSPDEDLVAYTVERMDEKAKKYFTNIHVYDLNSGESYQYTRGDHVDGKPVFSADGSQIAFTSSRNKKNGIYVMPVGGGSEEQLLEVDGAVGSLQWTPDGKELVFGLRYNDSHFIEDEKKKKEQPVFRHVTRLFFRLDAEGYLPKDTFQVYALNVETKVLRQITKGKRDNEMPNVSPDGKWVVYTSNRAKDQDMDSLRQDLFVIPLKGGKERRLATPDGPCVAARFSPDSKTVAFLGHDDPDDAWGVKNMHIWKVGLTGKPTARDLMPKFDRMAEDSSIADMADFHGAGDMFWSKDGKRIYFLTSDTGVTNIFYVPASGGKPTRVFKGNCHVKGLSLAGKTKSIALIFADLTNPGDIMVCPAAFGGETRAKKLTDLNPFLQKERQLGKTREVWFKSFDGTKVQGWLITPPNFRTGKRYPSILQIHGGPRAQYAFSFFHEMQYLAAKGYVVLYTNPRGGTGRGETWADSIAGGWGDLDYKDCMAAADYLEKQRFIHPKKMGVTGGSYGGYMTNWIIGHTNRFKAAVTQRSICDLTPFVGGSDIGFALGREFDGFPWTNPENYEKCSPITYFKKVKTPVLIIHSEQDLRCNIEQAEQMFAMLKILKKKVEMVRFPEEPHGLSRHGRPDRRIARLNWIVKWFDRYLK